MTTPYLGEVKIVSFNFAPKNWAMCNGQLLPIAQNQALFSLLGTTYGGNGQTVFALPNLRGATPLHTGSQFALGQAGGELNHTLTQQEMPQHQHALQGVSRPGTAPLPAGQLLAAHRGGYTESPDATLSGVNFVIALTGVFPSRN